MLDAAFPSRSRLALLTVTEMGRADALTIAGGTPGESLMEAAGGAVADQVRRLWPGRPVVVLCGPGNNGGDGFVAARRLAEAGHAVRLALLGSVATLQGDAAGAARRWKGLVQPADLAILGDGAGAGAPVVVDALYGAGLSRPLDGVAKALVEACNERRLPVVAVDIPSGVHGDTGAVLGAAPRATVTVTFFRKKPGHLLLPGRVMAGEVVVADIGIPDRVLDPIGPTVFENDPELWRARYPWPSPEDHKYTRGHAVIGGGALMTGAARLAARGARRAGAGLVTIATPPEAFPVYAVAEAGALVHPVDDAGFSELLADPRRNAVLLGPGAGATAGTRRRVLAALAAGKTGVLDADAITAFADQPSALLDRLRDHGGRWLLTPHEGEFRRLFGAAAGDKLSRSRTAARRTGTAVLLKGADTVVAARHGRAVINTNAPPELATGGSGDVLAGIALGLIAQGMDPALAGCAAAWLHGAAAAEVGPGLIAEDLPEALPRVLKVLRGSGT